MKYATAFLILLTFFTVTGCSGNQTLATGGPAVVQPGESATVFPESTATYTPASTATPVFTLTASPTIYVTPTTIANPENLVLAEKGYDIADVRLSFPREDTVVVDFKYRLDESRKSKDTYIYMTIPPQCRDDVNGYSPPQYIAKNLTGEVQFIFKMTLEGVCVADSIEFTFYPDPNREANPPFYREYVLQPYRLVRNFPTLNSDTLSVANFKFTADVLWKGVFTFDYSISEEIPIPPEEYFFVVRGFGPDGGCAFWAQGPVLTGHSGEYQISLDLAYNLLFPYQNCLTGLEKYTYTTSFLYLRDAAVNKDVYSEALTDPYTIWKSR